jgi:hypothetical protein
MRGLWRYLVWAMLLWRIASLKLRLVATHPDGKAGLAFLAEYPNAYSMFVFGLSASMAITVVRHVFESNISSVTFGYIIAGWLAIVFAFFAFPLLAFSKPLSELKDRSLQILAARRRWPTGRPSGRSLAAMSLRTTPRKPIRTTRFPTRPGSTPFRRSSRSSS